MRGASHYWLAGALGNRLLGGIMATARFRVMSAEPHKLFLERTGVVYALWHGRLLPLTYFHRDQRIATLISQSSDGEYIARVVQRWGYTAVRGSSSRGGSSALREMVKLARMKRSFAITPDGPRGPRQKLKPGVLTLAQLTGQPIIPATASATRAWWVDARWDLFLVPKPFATVYVRYGDPVFVPRGATEAEVQGIGDVIEAALNQLTEQTDRDAGR